jgi:hypothetical protein
MSETLMDELERKLYRPTSGPAADSASRAATPAYLPPEWWREHWSEIDKRIYKARRDVGCAMVAARGAGALAGGRKTRMKATLAQPMSFRRRCRR